MKTKLIILLIVLVAAALRLYQIEQKNLWFDEVYSWKITQGSIVSIVSLTSGDIHPPFYYIVLKFWISVFSDSIFSMRVLSTVLSVLTIFFIYKLSKIFLKNDYQIVLVILLYALSPLNIYYSQEVRMQNLNLFLCTGAVYYLYNFFKIPSVRNGVLYSICTVLALYTHYFAFLIFITGLIVVLIFYFKKKIGVKIIKKYLLYFLIINLLYIPWYPVLFNHFLKGQPWRTQQNTFEVFIGLMNYFKDVYLSIYYISENPLFNYFATFLSLFIIIFFIFSQFRISGTKSFFSKANSITLFAFVPLLIAVVVSFNQSIALSRYLSILVPFLLMSSVYLLFRLYRKKIAIVVSACLIIISCFGVYINFQNDFKNNDYRQIISYLEDHYNNGDEIVVEPHYMSWFFDYHISHNDSKLKSPKILGWNLDMQADSLHRSPNLEKIWLIIDYSSLENHDYDNRAEILSSIGYNKISSCVFYTIPSKVVVEFYKKSI